MTPTQENCVQEVVVPVSIVYYVTGGNQRELARQKNLKKTQEIHKGKRKEDSLSASQRKQRDSEIMQQKQKAANERKSLQAGAK
ncbi:small EDRK-rich factor 1 isoform X1 [Egretta garzetta]|uniref:small EDRK-rich factor 1 isoform X1 n=1 Tax=Egretta garzetta TaxID=188379 RepID=UPI00051F10E9|nr:small EDRK-rich factor 1 isoform X1 [Egretta garzetta]